MEPVVMRAWFVEVRDFECCIAAPTRAKATADALKCAREANYNFRWTEFKVRRWSKNDRWAQTRAIPGRTYAADDSDLDA